MGRYEVQAGRDAVLQRAAAANVPRRRLTAAAVAAAAAAIGVGFCASAAVVVAAAAAAFDHVIVLCLAGQNEGDDMAQVAAQVEVLTPAWQVLWGDKEQGGAANIGAGQEGQEAYVGCMVVLVW